MVGFEIKNDFKTKGLSGRIYYFDQVDFGCDGIKSISAKLFCEALDEDYYKGNLIAGLYQTSPKCLKIHSFKSIKDKNDFIKFVNQMEEVSDKFISNIFFYKSHVNSVGKDHIAMIEDIKEVFPFNRIQDF